MDSGLYTSSALKSGVVSTPVPQSAAPAPVNVFARRRALQVCAEAQALHFKGQSAKAIPLYGKSIEIQPTAEAHCFLGWAYSAHGRFDLGIRECLKAIALDADFGNSYNDLGSYLVSQGKIEQSIVWFERAKKAARYESRHFPYMNLGRLYSSRGWKIRAIREFEKALEHRPGEASCVEALKDLKKAISITSSTRAS